jgi:hypothetical protein
MRRPQSTSDITIRDDSNKKIMRVDHGKLVEVMFGHEFLCVQDISVLVDGYGISGHYFADKHFSLQWLWTLVP